MRKSHTMIQLSDHFTYGKLLRFVMPSILMILCMSVYSIVDGFFVSNFVSKTAFAAVNLMMPVLMGVATIGFMIGTGGSAVVSKTLGEGDKARANQYFTMLILFAFVISAVLAVIGFLFAPQIAIGFGAKKEMLKDCILYSRILFVVTPLFVLQQAFQSFYVAAQKPELSLKISIFAGLTNMLLDYLLIVPLQMGLAGAAIATAVSQAVGGIFPIFYFIRKNNSSLLRLQFPFSLHWRTLRIACANGSSEMVSNLSISLVSILYNYQLMQFAGEDGIAAYGVIMYVAIIFNAVFMGYSIGSAPIVSFHYGAKNHAELKNMFRKGILLIGGSSIVITAAAIGFAKPLAMIFTSYDAGLLALTTRACQIYSICYLFMGMNIWVSSFFTALNNGLISACISFLRTFLFQIAAILLLPQLLGIDGIWSSVVLAEFIAVLISLAFLFGKRKQYQY